MKKIIKNKKVVLITGEQNEEAAQALHFILKDKYSVFRFKGLPKIYYFFSLLKSEVVIVEDDPEINPQKIVSFFPSKFFLLVTQERKKTRIKKFLRQFPESGFLAIDFSVANKIRGKNFQKVSTFGIEKKNADFYISDISKGEKETNFKINYKENIVPFWIKGKVKRKKIYGVLSALCLGESLHINLAEASQRLRSSFYFTGK